MAMQMFGGGGQVDEPMPVLGDPIDRYPQGEGQGCQSLDRYGFHHEGSVE